MAGEPGAGSVDNAPKSEAPKAEAPKATGGDKAAPKSFSVEGLKTLVGQSDMTVDQGNKMTAEAGLRNLTAVNIRATEQPQPENDGLPTLESPWIMKPPTPEGGQTDKDIKPTDEKAEEPAEKHTEAPAQATTEQAAQQDAQADAKDKGVKQWLNRTRNRFFGTKLNTPKIDNLDLRRPPADGETPATPNTEQPAAESTDDPNERAAMDRAKQVLGEDNAAIAASQATEDPQSAKQPDAGGDAAAKPEGAELSPTERRQNAEARLKQLGANVEDQKVKDLLAEVEASPEGMELLEKTLDTLKPKEGEVEARAAETGLTEENVAKMLANGEIKQLLELINEGMKQGEGKQLTEDQKKWFDKLALWQKIVLIVGGALAGATVAGVAGSASMLSKGSQQ